MRDGPSFVFGLDSERNTLICAEQGAWVRVDPLVGEREIALPCDSAGDTAQQPLAGNDLQPVRTPGVPLQCAKLNGAVDAFVKVPTHPSAGAVVGHAGQEQPVRRLRHLAVESRTQVALVFDPVHFGRAEPACLVAPRRTARQQPSPHVTSNT